MGKELVPVCKKDGQYYAAVETKDDKPLEVLVNLLPNGSPPTANVYDSEPDKTIITFNIPIAKDGKDGSNGRDGVDVDMNAIMQNVNEWLLANAHSGVDGKDGVNGKDGENGRDGVDADMNAIMQNVNTWLLANVHNGVDGKDGANGKDGKDAELDESKLTSIINQYFTENIEQIVRQYIVGHLPAYDTEMFVKKTEICEIIKDCEDCPTCIPATPAFLTTQPREGNIGNYNDIAKSVDDGLKQLTAYYENMFSPCYVPNEITQKIEQATLINNNFGKNGNNTVSLTDATITYNSIVGTGAVTLWSAKTSQEWQDYHKANPCV
ncbi:MAG: hypothetical protein LBO69_05410 [Ignavibacteria bacterium]|jgi:hypothetical protein|nr:hypothetical protein [Ignavibacteria bacterium]